MTIFARHTLIILLVFLGGSLAAVEVRIASFNVRLGLGPESDLGRINAAAVLARLDPDIVGLQEIDNQDLNNDYLIDFANDLGLPFVFVPRNALDTSSRVAILSRFPFVPGSTESILSPAGANDMTRAAAVATVDVPGTLNDPVIINAHLKCCFDNDDPFRRAVEMLRIRKHLEDNQLGGDDNLFVMGDLNLLGNRNLTFSSLPGGLPPSYVLGPDISFPVVYSPNPVEYLGDLGMVNPGYRQQDGITTDTFRNSDTVLDYLLVSSAVADRNPATEIYNSQLETSFPGLPKEGEPLPASASDFASDHFPVYGDYDLAAVLPLSLAITESVIFEGDNDAVLTVTLDRPAARATEVNLTSSDPGEAQAVETTLVIPAGERTATTRVEGFRDRISDGIQTVEITATAPGYQRASAQLLVRDLDLRIYVLARPGNPITESFEDFDGTQPPATWRDSGIAWRGRDDGTNPESGARFYQDSLGLLSAEPASFRALFRSEAAEVIDALEISYTGEHWRRAADGSRDRLSVSLIRGEEMIALPELTFSPSPAGPPGALSPPEEERFSTFVRGLHLTPGEEFDLLFELIPGEPVASGLDDVFINEFHYDNLGSDRGEFVEVFVGEDFTGELSDVSLQLYNGSNGRSYGARQSLATFLRPPDPEGPGLYHKFFSGIQNGSPDGLALLVNGSVREFLSYEGAFTAVDGVAAGLSSTPIGVAQVGIEPGRNSIARTGTGQRAEDFRWTLQPGLHTPGLLNVGQSFGASAKPQGLAIDDLSVTLLIDRDGDLLPDAEEQRLGTDPTRRDSDGDGQDDFFESRLSETDPLSGSSFFATTLSIRDGVPRLRFATLPGRLYQLESSRDLVNWTPSTPVPGTGEVLEIAGPISPDRFYRVRISRP